MTNLRIILPVIAAALVVCAVVVTFWMIGSASGERDRFSSLGIAPAETDIFFAVNTDPTSPQWLSVNRSLDSINAKDPVRRALDEALAEVNLDWEEDILPIAGDEAFLSVPNIEEVSESGGYLAGFRLRDEDGARDVFEKLRAFAEDEDGEEFLEEEYEGVTIFYTEPAQIGGDGGAGAEPPDPFDGLFFECLLQDPETAPGECAPLFECPWYTDDPSDDFDFEDLDDNGVPDACETGPFFGDDGFFGDGGGSSGFGVSPGAAVAIFDDVLALAGDPDGVKSIVDVVQGRADSAETNERLQEFRERQREDFLVWGYVDMEPVWDMASSFLDAYGAEASGGYDLAELEELLRGQLDRMGFAVSSFGDGFALDFTVLQAPDYEPPIAWEPSREFEPRFAGSVPEDTLFFMAGNVLTGQFEDGLDALRDEDRESWQAFVDLVRDETDIDVEALLQTFSGEAALALDASDFSGDVAVEVAAFAEVDDETAVVDALDAAGDYLEGQGILAVSTEDDMTLWSSLDAFPGGDTGGWRVRDGIAVIGYPAEVIDRADGLEGPSLADSGDWRGALRLLPAERDFIGYLSLARIIEEARADPDAEASFEQSTGGELTLEDLEPLRSVAFSGTTFENGAGFSVVLFMEDR